MTASSLRIEAEIRRALSGPTSSKRVICTVLRRRSATRIQAGTIGVMLFLVFETVFSNRDGQVVAKHVGTRIRR